MKILLIILLVMGTVRADIPPPKVGIDQHIGAQLPMDLPFQGETDRHMRPLREFFRPERPAIFVMGYFECPQLCSVVMNALVSSLTEIKPQVGRDFDVFFVSIDPKETADLAAEKKRNYVRSYGKEETTDGWHFLTGDSQAIASLAKSIGFRYFYDADLRQFAHASGLTIVTPTGKISRYFYGIEFPAKELAVALEDARSEHEGSPAVELLLMCYHYNPITGPYGMVIWRILQGSALLTLGVLGYFIINNLWKERKEHP